ncbi:MAG: NifB/NifX family molybdenum-iron cluster-binding protein [Anaerotardibacter sp.]
MQIAVASEGLNVCPIFSACSNFNYYKIEDGQIVASRNLPSQGHLCGSQANFLRQIDVKVLLCDRIQNKEIDSLNAAGITVISNVSGRAIDCVCDYLNDTLENFEVFE